MSKLMETKLSGTVRSSKPDQTTATITGLPRHGSLAPRCAKSFAVPAISLTEVKETNLSRWTEVHLVVSYYGVGLHHTKHFYLATQTALGGEPLSIILVIAEPAICRRLLPNSFRASL